MALSEEFNIWINKMYEFLKNLKTTQTVTDIHPPMPGTVVQNQSIGNVPPSSTPETGSDQTSNVVVTNNTTLPPKMTISPDFGEPLKNGKYPTKPAGSVLQIYVAPTPDFITAEVWTANQDGSPNTPVCFGDTLPGVDTLKMKLLRLGLDLKPGQLMFLKVRTDPPGFGNEGLETNFQLS